MSVTRQQRQCAHCKKWYTQDLIKKDPGPPVCRECMN